MKKQTVVRTYPSFTRDYCLESHYESLKTMLESGWCVSMCNEIKREDGKTELEYILEKEVRK